MSSIFSTLNPFRLFIKCAVPNVISMAFISFYYRVDGIFVGKYLGSDALAALALIIPYYILNSFEFFHLHHCNHSLVLGLTSYNCNLVQIRDNISLFKELCVMASLFYLFLLNKYEVVIFQNHFHKVERF